MAHVLPQSLDTGSFSGSENEEINTSKSRVDDGTLPCEISKSDSEDEAGEIFEDATDKSPSSPSPKQLLPNLIAFTRPSVDKKETDQYHSLLHRKLRERNDRFKRELIALNRNPYKDAVRTVEECCSTAARSLNVMKDSSLRLKRLRDDMYLLKVAFDRLLINSSVLPRFKSNQESEFDGSSES